MSVIKTLTTQNPAASYTVGEPVIDPDGVEQTVTEIEQGRGGQHYLIYGTGDFVRLALPSEGIKIVLDV